jgi:DNA-binding CsgD family transcriptional regulator
VTALTGSDYRGALDVLRIAHESDDAVPFSGNMLAALRRLIPSAIATSQEWDPSLGYRVVVDGAARADFAPVWSLYEHVIDQDPFPARPQGPRGRVAPIGVACRISDVLSLRQFRRLDLHAEICRPLGIDHVMKLFFAVGETGAGYIVLDSQRRAFSDRDRAVLDVLAPHLALIRKRHRLLADPSPETLAAALLSAREREILGLVASGMTNREIAAVLFIAPGTVRKHLDNVYAKLGVRSRAQAVAVTVDRRQFARLEESQAVETLHG